MTQLLVIREALLKFYQNSNRILNPLFRFIIAFVTLMSISSLVGYSATLKLWYVIVVLSVVGAFLPASAMVFMGAVYTVMHVYTVSIVLAMVLSTVFILLYFVYIRFVPSHGYVILAVPVLYAIGIPYAAPLIMGLVSAPIGLVPMTCGVVVYYSLQAVTSVIGTATEDSLILYNQVVSTIFSNREMYMTICIFVIVMLIVCMIRNYEFNYACIIAILSGALANVILFLALNFASDMQISAPSLLIRTVISGLLAWVVQFFQYALNYAAVEYLQFEDDEYHYYVKAVPKVSVAARQKRVKRFNAHLFGENHKVEGEEGGDGSDLSGDTTPIKGTLRDTEEINHREE